MNTVEQKQLKELTPEEQEQAKQQSIAWQRECFQNAQKHLAEKGIMPKTVNDKESRYLAPFFAIWKIKSENGKNNEDLAPITICAFGLFSNTLFHTSTLSFTEYLEW